MKLIRDFDTLKVHDRIFLFGSPLGIFETESDGRMVIKDSGEEHFMVIFASATHGNSGGPVFDENGYIVGVLVAGSDSFTNLALCVPSWQLARFIAEK